MKGNYQEIITAMKNRKFTQSRNLDLEGAINYLFISCQQYWQYACQYEALKQLQNNHLPCFLPEDIPTKNDGSEKISILHTWILNELRNLYKQKCPDCSDKNFQEYICTKQNFEQWLMSCGVDKIYANELAKTINDVGKEGFSINANFKLENVKRNLEILRINLLPADKDIEECVNTVLTSDLTKRIVSGLQPATEAADIVLSFYISLIRSKLTVENIRNNTEVDPKETDHKKSTSNRKRQKTEILFAANCRREFHLILQGINNILSKYTLASDDNALRLTEQRTKQKLKELLQYKPQYIAFEKECHTQLTSLCRDWIDEYIVQIENFETNILPNIHISQL